MILLPDFKEERFKRTKHGVMLGGVSIWKTSKNASLQMRLMALKKTWQKKNILVSWSL